MMKLLKHLALGIGAAVLLLPAGAALPSPYHTSAEILAAFQEMADGGAACPGAALTLTLAGQETGVPLTVATFTQAGAVQGGSGSSSGEANKDGGGRPDAAFVLFGEHARELISPETALRMARDLCGINKRTAKLAAKVLARTVVTIVPNANPRGRASVEGGAFCQRVNENGVDLNRNWDAHWQSSSESGGADTNPGAAPFSEPETQATQSFMAEVAARQVRGSGCCRSRRPGGWTSHVVTHTLLTIIE